MLCPTCRKEFKIPQDGLDGLQHHFIVQQLVDVQKASGEESDKVLCEVCSEESEADSDKIPTATVYCVDCSQKLCERCSKPHRRWKGGSHLIKPLGAEVEQELTKLQGIYCEKHRDKQVELYCCDCSENICLMCFAVSHRDHKSIEIGETADSFAHRIGDDDQKVLSAVNTVREQSEQTKQDVAEFHVKVQNVGKLVLATGDQIKRTVDEQMSDIMKQLESVTTKSDKEAEYVLETYELAIGFMESFHTYAQELLEKGRPSDITGAACELHDRATELLSNDVTAVKYHPPHVTFTPVDVMQVKRLKLIGKVTVATGTEPGK